MSIHGTCEKCGGDTVNYRCLTCITRELDEALACAERVKAENLCDACAGTPISGLPCMCKGTAKMSVAAITLREDLIKAEAEVARLRVDRHRWKCRLARRTMFMRELSWIETDSNAHEVTRLRADRHLWKARWAALVIAVRQIRREIHRLRLALDALSVECGNAERGVARLAGEVARLRRGRHDWKAQWAFEVRADLRARAYAEDREERLWACLDRMLLVKALDLRHPAIDPLNARRLDDLEQALGIGTKEGSP